MRRNGLAVLGLVLAEAVAFGEEPGAAPKPTDPKAAAPSESRHHHHHSSDSSKSSGGGSSGSSGSGSSSGSSSSSGSGPSSSGSTSGSSTSSSGNSSGGSSSASSVAGSVDRKLSLALVKPWLDRCPELGAVERAAEVRAKKLEGGVDLRYREASASKSGLGERYRYRITGAGCEAVGIVDSGQDGDLTSSVYYLGVKRAKPDDATAAALDERELGRLDDARHAVSRLLTWLQSDNEPDDGGGPPPIGPGGRPRLVGPSVRPVQPEFADKPQGAPATLWSAATLAGLGIRPLPLEGETRPADAVLVARIDKPEEVVSQGHYRLFRATWKSRHGNGGGALAVYDERTNKHRYLLATAEDACSPRLLLVPLEEELMVARTCTAGGRSLYLVDLQRGVVRRFYTRGPADIEYRKSDSHANGPSVRVRAASHKTPFESYSVTIAELRAAMQAD